VKNKITGEKAQVTEKREIKVMMHKMRRGRKEQKKTKRKNRRSKG
jgi:hypothetical protein